MKSRKTFLFAVLLCLGVLVMMGTVFGREIFLDVNYPAIEEPNHTGRPEYVENEIIIKYHGNAAEAIEMGLAKGRAAHELKLSDSLDKLNKKYKLRKAKPLFKNFKENRQRVKTLAKKDKALLSKKEKHILRRLKRAPKGARVPDLSRIYKLELELEPGQALQEVVEAYQSNAGVEYAELNYIVSIHNKPNDPCYPLQWPLNNTGQMYPESGSYNPPPGTPDCDIDAPEAWDIFTGSSEVIIAVVDTGVDYNHRDLQGNMWTDSNGFYGYDFINGDNDPMDDHGHGTHCSGIIAAEGNNGLDITGVCWDAKIMALKFLDAGGYGSSSDAVEAFYYAVENGADITSNSWGGGGYSETVQEAINYAYSQGVVMIAAAGNDNSTAPHYPAYSEHMISVAATNSNDEKASFSSYGDWVDIAAPGVDVLSLRASGTSMGTPYDAYTTIVSGTSMACPHVAGVCALLVSICSKIQVDELEQALINSADAISPSISASGRLNAYQALLQMINPQGRVVLDSVVYPCSATVDIRLSDSDLQGQGIYDVAVETDGGDFETVSLTETAAAVGVFTGTIATTSGDLCVEDGTVQVSHGEIITVTYEDANDGTGNPVTITDTAIVDCESPEISNVHIILPGREPWVRFETDEPATARVLCGLACGGPYTIARKGFTLTTHHAVKLKELSPETEYFFIIEANDVVGNGTIDTNDGECYSFTTIAASGEIYVPSQCRIIQEAIDNCWDGMTVWVADGTYTGAGNREIDFHGKAITVTSENGPENCIIDCNGTKAESHRGFYFHSGEDANSVLAGFTITNGYISGSWYVGIGGAIRCEDNSSPTIDNCIITGNSAGWDGGGINNINSSPTITNCTFSANSAVGNDGGGINNENSSPTITNCTFSGNSAYDWGGAIRNIFYCSPTITNCTFTGNTADDGGGMFYFYKSSPTITNCTISGNSARKGGGMYNWTSSPRLTNCILWGNTASDGNEIALTNSSTIDVNYCDVKDGNDGIYNSGSTVNWGSGNIEADPMFFDANNPDPNLRDYHIRPGSPCIDAGDPNFVAGPNETDIDGQRRVWDGRVDMGADEFVPMIEVQMKFTPQALNPGSKGNWMKAHFVLPEGFIVEDVDASRPAWIEPLGIESEYMNIFINEDGLVEIEAAFSRAEFCAAGPADGTVTVIGVFGTGQYFYGTDTIKIITGNFKYLGVLASHWLEQDCGKPDWCSGLDVDQDSVVNFVDFAMFDGCCIEIIKK